MKNKKETSVDASKKLIKKWQPGNCPGRYVNHTYKISVLFKIHGNCFDLLFSVLYMAFNTVIGFGNLFGWHRLAMIIHGAA